MHSHPMSRARTALPWWAVASIPWPRLWLSPFPRQRAALSPSHTVLLQRKLLCTAALKERGCYVPPQVGQSACLNHFGSSYVLTQSLTNTDSIFSTLSYSPALFYFVAGVPVLPTGSTLTWSLCCLTPPFPVDVWWWLFISSFLTLQDAPVLSCLCPAPP